MKYNINNRASFPELKRVLTQEGVSASAVSNLEKALDRGMEFRARGDLGILKIFDTELNVIVNNVEFGPREIVDKNLKRIQYTFKPVGNEKFFYGYQFVVIYTNNDRFIVEQSYPIEDQGIVVIDLDTTDILYDSNVLFRVKTAQGKYTNIRLGEEDIEPKEDIIEVPIPRLENKIIRVEVDDLTLTEEITPIPSSYRIRGKLLSNNGETKLDGYQIVIYAATANLPDGSPDFLPVAFATTETNGYFVTSYLAFTHPDDITKVKEGQATIVKEDLNKSQPIRLIKKTETVNSEGGDGPITITKTMLPDRLILVIEEAGNQEDDCKDCGCNELNFYEKKVLEEYSYYTVVRTTEPSIIGDVLEEEKEINLAEIYNPIYKFDLITLYGTWVTAVPLPVFRKFQAIQSRQVKRKTFSSFLPQFSVVTETTPYSNAMLPPGNRVANVMDDIAAVSNVPTDRALEGDITKEIINIDLLKQILTDYYAKKRMQGNEKPVLRGRTRLGPLQQIDWDEEPTIYQAASIAHGHVLRFIQEWLPDGYSLGDLLYSLPLAPGQKKQIAVLDWERRESAANSQVVDYEEVLNNSLIRDRDINEVVNATLTENIKASSKASTGGIGFGTGAAGMGSYEAFSFGGLIGISGGKSSAGAVATQNAFRESTGSSFQSLHDRTMQAASVVRSLRSTVVQTVSQGERMQATAESVANYNHCHAITIQYFEVLRHFTVRNRLAGVQECLFIPLQMAPFDLEKCLRWRNTLEKYLLKPTLRAGFDAAARLQNERESTDNYYDSIGFPRTTYAEENIVVYTGDLFIEFAFFNAELERLRDFLKLFDLTPEDFEGGDRKISDRELAERIGPRAIEYLLDTLIIETDKGVDLKLDLTLLSTFQQNATLRVSMRQQGTTPRNIRRDQINGINVKLDLTKLPDDQERANLIQYQNKYMKMRLRSGILRYRTEHFAGILFEGRIENDIFAGTDGVFIDTSVLTKDEMRNPRGEDVDAANNLIHHLNENMEHYHKSIFFDMTPERRFMLLDGIIAPGKAEGRSVASVVENRVIGIAGNSLIMPVAPGYQLDPTIDEYFDMFAQYYTEDQEPMRISMPTHGVYAEAVMGQCNSCEEKDETRFWRWEESPIPDSPTTQILPINTDTRRADPGNLQPKDFPAPIVNIQNAPGAPDPTGLQNILQLLGKGDSFRDLTGLNQNQLNALATYQKNLDTALAFGKEAAELAKAAGANKLIADGKRGGTLSNDKAQELTEKNIRATIPLSQEETMSQAQKQLDLINTLEQQGGLSSEDAQSARKNILDNLTQGRDAAVTHAVFAASDSGKPFSVEHTTADGMTTVSLASDAGIGAASGSAVPTRLNVTFIIVNRVLETDPVQGVTLTLDPRGSNISMTNNRSNRVTMDLTGLADGPFEVEVNPRDVYPLFPMGNFTAIGEPGTNPPNRMWLPHTAVITKAGNTFTSSDPRVSIQNLNITIRLHPLWMAIAANTSRGTAVPSVIVVHHTDDENRAKDEHGNRIYDPNFHSKIDSSIRAWMGNGYAPHYVIDRDGSVVKLGHERRQAYHADPAKWDGQRTVNPFSIGIEIVHTNNARPNNGPPTYTEDYTEDQYTSLILLLTDITREFNIPVYNIVGHSDVAIARNSIIVGRKSGDPGIKFDWKRLENAGLGLQRIEGPIDLSTVYGGFFISHTNGRIRSGAPGVTPAIVAELKADLTRIGYSVTDNNDYDSSVERVIMVFCEHFLALDHQSSVNEEIAEVIKRVVMYLATVKP